ncbi:TPA: hypothetical protein LA742_002987 [Clostridium botulinum]|uniref:Uncharacterized protein n=1 Tax=Clostridium sporogenes TaxID=1509 RepID=A0AAE6IB18_CLOSG|nr:hypothetical protein [Clostridium sporogenes]AUM93727.1 hypothetical protein RSJ11_00495 [Clostridium sporogenes]QDY34556.1 hypothetical protein CGS26_19850 [Clostridium sporogenes]HBJ2614492.1 hypothetical protein [Clostridium botulinum]
MIAKEMFKKLGYEQKIYNKEKNPNLNAIQYIKRANDSEMQRIGMIITKCIEFYTFPIKEIVIYTTYEHKNGKKSKSDMGILNLEEFNAIEKQVLELEWQD